MAGQQDEREDKRREFLEFGHPGEAMVHVMLL